MHSSFPIVSHLLNKTRIIYSTEPNSFSKDDSITTDQKIHKVGPFNIFKTTDENVRDWISSELDHSPKDKDYESGIEYFLLTFILDQTYHYRQTYNEEITKKIN